MSQPQPIKLMIAIVDLAAGTGTVVRNLGAGLKKCFPGEFEVTLLAFRNEPISAEDQKCFDQIHTLGLKVRPGIRQMLELPRAISRMRRAVRELNPSIILSVHTFANWLSARCAGDVPVVLTDHINLTERQAARGRSSVAISSMRAMYARHLAIGVSHDITYDLRLNFGATRTATILNGVDVRTIRERSQETPIVSVPQPYVIALGRLFPQKDYPTLIRAYHLACTRGLKAHLVIVGDGPQRGEIEKLIEDLNLGQSVHLIGHQENPFPYLRDARMLALSSTYEGFGMVLAEALALGVPCVSTDCPSGPSEILAAGEFGLLVPTGDPTKLADAIVQLDTDQALRQRLSAKSNVRAMQLDIEPMIRRYREVLIGELKTAGQAG